MSDQPFTATRVWHPSGLQLTVSVPLNCNSIKDFGDAEAQSINAFVETLLRNGLRISAPGVEAGEEIETVGLMCRRSGHNNNGDEIAVIDLYPDTDNPEVKYKMATLYLDSDEDVASFEAGSGVRLNQIPFYEGSKPLDKDDRMAAKYLYAPNPKPRIVMKANPKYNPEETDPSKKKPKRLPVRWFGVTVTGDEEPRPNSSSAGSGDGTKGGASSSHWASSEPARKAIADRFEKHGITGRDAVTNAMGRIERGVTSLRDSRIASLQDYLNAIDAKFGKASRAGGGEAEDQVPF